MDSFAIKAAVEEALRASKPVDLRIRDTCLRNLAFIYHTMVATEDLFLAAIEKSSGDLKAYFVQHHAEEMGHAQWLAADLDGAGFDVRSPSEIAIALVGSVYYLVKHVHPAAMLGYMLLMEGFPPSLEHIEAMEKEHGSAMFKTLRFHAEHDIDHGAEVIRQIDLLPAATRAVVRDCAVLSARYMALASHTF